MLLVIPHPTINDLIMWPEARTGATGDLTSVSTHRPLPDSDPEDAVLSNGSEGAVLPWYQGENREASRGNRATAGVCWVGPAIEIGVLPGLSLERKQGEFARPDREQIS